MPWGFKKGDKDAESADLDSKKSSLFGNRSKTPKNAAPSASSQNPYAVPAANDPYAARSSNPYAAQNGRPNDPYSSQAPASSTNTFASASDVSRPPAYSASGYGNGPVPNRDNKTPVPPGGYGGPQGRSQGAGSSYGQASGYGSNQYGNSEPQASRYGAAGYGGLGRSNSQETMSTEVGRNALFGDAAQRAATKPPSAAPEPNGDSSYSNGNNSYTGTGGYDSTEMPGGYGAGPSRELTAEEEEDQEVSAIKQETRHLKVKTVEASRRAVAASEQGMENMNDIMSRLAAQSERLHNADANLNAADKQNRLASTQTDQLKFENRSMFRPGFDTNKKKEARQRMAIDDHKREREQRETAAKAAYGSQARQQAHQRELGRSGAGGTNNGPDLNARSKYQFEPDESDDELENEQEHLEKTLLRNATQLNQGAQMIGEEVDRQNEFLDKISGKVDHVDDGIHRNTHRLKEFSKKW